MAFSTTRPPTFPDLPATQPVAASAPARAEDWSAAAYGNKTANLGRLSRLLDGQAEVPAFHGVSDREVKNFLGGEFMQRLRRLRRSLEADQKAQKQQPTTAPALSETSQALLREMHAYLHQAFAKTDPIVLPGGLEMLTWLKTHADARLMVRSTGHEDSDVVANAGGNESVANVAANPAEVKAAMVRVLQSYFSPKSLQQRIATGDDVSAPAFVPILVQKMVGERADGKVPSSGVLFTQESEGPTPHVSQIQTTFGHNEAVVASLLPSDTFLVNDLAVNKVVRRKPERMAPKPAPARGLRRVANSASLRAEPAISNDVAKKLHAIGKLVSEDFGGPMDIEWTYDRDQEIIYLLQARPLVPQPTSEPDHVAPAVLQGAKQLTGEVVGAAGGQVRTVQNLDQLLVAPTLADALTLFLARGEDSERRGRGVQAVFVTQPTEATSHEATTFRGVSVPVVRVASLQAVTAFVQAEAPVLLDTSKGALVSGRNLFANGVLRPGVVVPGWGKHPLPARLTTGVDLANVQQAQALDNFARGLLADQGQPPAAPGRHSALVLYQAMQQAPALQAGAAKDFATLLGKVASATSAGARAQAYVQLLRVVTQMATWIGKDPALRARTTALLQQTVATAARAYAASKSHNNILFLYEFNWLTAALSQEQDDFALGADSLLGLAAEHKEIQLLRAAAQATRSQPLPLAQADAATYAQAVSRLSRWAMQTQLQEQWQTFANTLLANDAGRSLFAQLAVALQGQNITGLWMNTVFADAVQQASRRRANAAADLDAVTALATTFLAELVPNPAGQSPAATWLHDAHGVTEKWQARLGQWSDVAGAQSLLPEFTADMDDLMAQTGPEVFAQAGPSQRLRMLATLTQVIETFDHTIKAVTGSPQFEAPVKLALFSQLVVNFAKLMPTWLGAATPELASAWRHYNDRSTANEVIALDVLELLETAARLNVQRLEHAPTPEILYAAQQAMQPSAGFSVQAAQLGSLSSFDQNKPKTLEDHFTFVHQSMLQIVAVATTKLGLTVSKLPAALQTFTRALLPPADAPNVMRGGFNAQVTSIDVQPGRTTVNLNVSMREHSVQLQLVQDKNNLDRLKVEVQYFSALDENYRIGRARLAAYFLTSSLDARFVGNQAPTWDPNKRLASWAWDMPLAALGPKEVASRTRLCMEYIDRTSYNADDEEVLLVTQLQAFEAFCPRMDERLMKLDKAFFCAYPWHNDEFFELLREQGREDTEVFKNLCAAIETRPIEQNLRWYSASEYCEPKRADELTAEQILQQWRWRKYAPARLDPSFLPFSQRVANEAKAQNPFVSRFSDDGDSAAEGSAEYYLSSSAESSQAELSDFSPTNSPGGFRLAREHEDPFVFSDDDSNKVKSAARPLQESTNNPGRRPRK